MDIVCTTVYDYTIGITIIGHYWFFIIFWQNKKKLYYAIVISKNSIISYKRDTNCIKRVFLKWWESYLTEVTCKCHSPHVQLFIGLFECPSKPRRCRFAGLEYGAPVGGQTFSRQR